MQPWSRYPMQLTSNAVDMRCKVSLDLGETHPEAPGGFSAPSQSAALRFDHTGAPSTSPLPHPLKPACSRPGEEHRRSVYWVRITGAHCAFDLLVVIALKFESHSAIFERENCIAAGGRRFQMLKFRTRRDPDRAPRDLGDNSTALD